jgi:hypothetical protein
MASKLLVALATLTTSIVSVTGFSPPSIGITHEATSSVSRSLRFRPLVHPKSLCAASRNRFAGLSMAETTIDSLVEKVKSVTVGSKGPDKIFKSIKKANGAPSVTCFCFLLELAFDCLDRFA